MGNRHDHLAFDELLRRNGHIEIRENDCDAVHDYMDYGSETHRRDAPVHTDEGIDRWIRDGRNSFWDNILSGTVVGLTVGAIDPVVNVHGHKLSDFKRVALGHLVLDEFWTKYRMNSNSPEKDTDEVMQHAFDAFIRRGLHRARFRH